jgi:hypothetical protein
MALAQSVRGSYRTMLRTINTVFRGDKMALIQTRETARQGFRANLGVRDTDAIGAFQGFMCCRESFQHVSGYFLDSSALCS